MIRNVFFFCFIFVVSFVILRFFFYSYFCSCPAFTGNIFIFFVLARVPCSVFPGALFLFSFIYSCILLCIFFVYCRCIFVASETETHTHTHTHTNFFVPLSVLRCLRLDRIWCCPFLVHHNCIKCTQTHINSQFTYIHAYSCSMSISWADTFCIYAKCHTWNCRSQSWKMRLNG